MNDTRKVYLTAASRLAEKAQRNMQPTVAKTKAAHSLYIINNEALYTEDEMETVQHFLDAFLYKYQLANFSLEQLWTIRDGKIESNMLEIVRNTIVELELSDSEQFLQSHSLEQFLFQGRSCLDFYMLYISHLLRTGHQGSMSTKTFYKGLPKAQPDCLHVKAGKVEKYFKSHVFGSDEKSDELVPMNWGELLRSLRDKIAHKDRIKVSRKSLDKIMNDILVDFPTIRDLTYERFCQEMENGLWNMVCDLFPVLYDIKWQAGPYKEGMFET